MQANVGSCTCLTKSPCAEHHADNCRHKYIQEAIDLLDDRHCDDCNAPRSVDICHKCNTPTQPVPKHWDYPKLPDVQIMRQLAKEVGYALAIHGTLERDLDLVAVPWVDEAVSQEELVEHIAQGINARILCPEQKPLGRYAVNLQIDGWYKLIDLSVAAKGKYNE